MGECNKQMSYVRSSIGIESLPMDQVEQMDVYAEDYFGKSYMSKTLDELMDEAETNDIMIRVLENAKKNSIEKKLLADKGKWDIFVDLNAQHDFESRGNYRDDNGYSVGIGFSIQKIDSTLLNYTSRWAEAEIKKFDAEISSQQLNTRTGIDREWNIAVAKREICEKLVVNLESRREVYLQKKEDYTNGKESIDNLISAREEIRQTQMDLLMNLDDCYESITNLNHACGVYFKELGINI
jgi:outer membrane protein TolC